MQYHDHTPRTPPPLPQSPSSTASDTASSDTANSDSDEMIPGEEALQYFGTILRRRIPTSDSEAESRVMATIRNSPRWHARAARGWWFRPRQVPISPFTGLVAAGMMAMLLVMMVRHAAIQTPRVVKPTTAAALPLAAGNIHVVRFVLAAPGVSRVNLVGDFNEWNTIATPLQAMGAAGVWTVDVPLPPGRHEYAFVIDGQEWRSDPAAPRAPANDYGLPNSVVTIEAQSS